MCLSGLLGSTLLISESGVESVFECFVSWFSVEFTTKLKGSEIQ